MNKDFSQLQNYQLLHLESFLWLRLEEMKVQTHQVILRIIHLPQSPNRYQHLDRKSMHLQS